MKEKTTIEAQKGTKYSFVGRPDFNRIIQENEGADVIIVSREDGLVCFLFRVEHDRIENSTLAVSGGLEFEWATYHEGSNERLPKGWVYHSNDHPDSIKKLRQVAQRFVRARTGKHTVEVLP